jgi:Na+/melibiose symporter-like transporter
MKTLTKGKMWLFSVGQFGWSLLSGLVVSWLVYFYQPDTQSVAAGQIPLIPQGRVIFGVLTIIGIITASGRVFDAVTDPLLASLSDRCRSKEGRRIPFLKWSAVPFALTAVLVFCAPFKPESMANALWLFFFTGLYYLFMTAYCTPYTALFSEIAHTEKERMNTSTAISLTFILGTAVAYVAPAVWNVFEPSMGRISAIRFTFMLLASAALVCLFFPVFFIKEKDFVDAVPASGTAFGSFRKILGNRNFRIFVGSDVLYWIALTMFQTGLPFFITVLMGLPERMFTPMFIGMTALSVMFYVPVNFVTRHTGKKKMVLSAFLMFTFTYLVTAFTGKTLAVPPVVQGCVIVITGAAALAIFGILPQAMVADVAEYDAECTGENHQGMFFAVRTFCYKLGQSIAMLLFTSFATVGSATGAGYRIVAAVAAVFCLCGGIILIFFDEKKISDALHGQSRREYSEKY